ncbi:PGF-CTERM sorting domain-containing protein [Haloarcula onubensis]|uniref:PGF-CTERM sorting domain-containing protein n=1 Tax=Haloarcula onubensis TaxID=2950539 RepID=A0ABU2FJ83_9EURY|nr:PGF-CTERM sorting domain-containing protein [Halomicroarcula sp. S3CR25-11]MDS0280813.1 PGF-CTERM sorting domain-containing protein [Halomicroarcula sp. S3CR25-11]
MGSTRVSVGLCIVMLVGVVGALPAAVTAQQDQVTVTMTIVDEDGRPVDGGIDVMASWDGGSVNGTTASNGQVLLDVPRGENVSIQIDDDRYVRNIPYTIEDATSESVDVPVADSGTATITVRNTENDTVENARVLLYQSGQYVTDQRTGADGTVTTPRVEQGAYRLTILKAGYFDDRTRIEVGSQTTINQTIEQGEVLLTVAVEDDYFEPPESLDAAVEIPGFGTLQTGSDGDASTTVAVNTRYDITVTADGYDRAQQTVSVGEDDITRTVSLDRTDEINLTAQDQVVIGQRVPITATDEYDDPVVGATVTQDGQEVGTTNEDGVVRVRPESAGTVTYTIDDGDTSETVSIEVFDPDATPTASAPSATPSPTPTATDSPPAGTETSGGGGPGFTPVTVVAALALLSLVAYRHR